MEGPQRCSVQDAELEPMEMNEAKDRQPVGTASRRLVL
jgi:hypothetical protein